jgi:hypothetical protein
MLPPIHGSYTPLFYIRFHAVFTNHLYITLIVMITLSFRTPEFFRNLGNYQSVSYIKVVLIRIYIITI